MSIELFASTIMARVQKRPVVSSDSGDLPHPFRESSPQRTKPGGRSCVGCYRRKVRCDHGVPCTNCSRNGFTCMYPTKHSEAARKHPTLQNISSRLERLEILLSRFAEETRAIREPAADVSSRDSSQTRIQPHSGAKFSVTANQYQSDQQPCKSTWELLLNDGIADQDVNHPNTEILLLDEENVKPAQPTSSETETAHPQKSKNNHRALLAQPGACAPSDMVSDVLEFYPGPELALRLWTVYVKSVDPVVKILHIPTAQSAVVATILDPKSAGSSTVALTFAIYFAAVTALSHDNKHEPIELPYEKPVLLKQYKIVLDRLLTVTDLMNRPEMTALQALGIYVTCLRVYEVGRSVWVLNGLAIRLAQSIGLHRDNNSLRLSHFEREMRLRLWWHLCVLDSRAPEDQGFQPTVDIMNQGLRLPLNVNDDQIYPDMTSFPVESNGWTEMSFFLIQTDSCRLLHPILGTQEQHSADALDITEKKKIIQEHGQYLSAKYGILSGSGTATDLSRIAEQHITTACKKMEFVFQLREEIIMQKQNEAQNEAQNDAISDVIKASFKLACDALESHSVLLKEGLASKFKWFFTMYTQWYALAYVLRCLCSSPCGFATERAWALVEELFPRRTSSHDHSQGLDDEYGYDSVWRYLRVLRSRALSSRQNAQQAVAVPDAEIALSSGGRPCSTQSLPDIEIPRPTGTTSTARGVFALPELSQDMVTGFIPNIFSSPDLSMPELLFWSDWNAVMNGGLNDDSY